MQTSRAASRLKVGGFAGVRLGFRFSTESQTAARKTQPKRSQLNRGGTSAPLDDELGRLEVRVGFGIGNKRWTNVRGNVRGQPPISNLLPLRICFFESPFELDGLENG